MDSPDSNRCRDLNFHSSGFCAILPLPLLRVYRPLVQRSGTLARFPVEHTGVQNFRKKLYVRSNPDETQINDHVVCDDTSRTLTPARALEHSRIAGDLERVEVLLKLNGPAVADRPDVGDLCFALLSLPVKPEVIVAESHNSLAAFALKDFVRVKDEFVETRR